MRSIQEEFAMALYVGDRGTAATPLQPQGIVLVKGERLDARAEFGLIEPGSEVVVVTGNHMGVVVRKLENGREPQLPDHGKKLCTSFDEHVTEESERAESEREARLEEHYRQGTAWTAAVGAGAAAAACSFLWSVLQDATGSPWGVAALIVFAGAVLGAGFFRGLDEVLGQIDPNFRGVTTVSTLLAIAGLATGSILAIPPLGIALGLIIGLTAALLLAAVPVVFIVITGSGEG